MTNRFVKHALSVMIACACVGALSLRLGADADDRFSDWSAPVNLGAAVNGAASEIEVALSRDGLSLYFSSDRPGGYGGFDLWVSQRASVDDVWETPQNLGPAINTPFQEQTPTLTIDGHRLYFNSDRPGGFGNRDLYVSRRQNKRDDFGWRTARNLGGLVNTTAAEAFPTPFEDDATGALILYFQSNRAGGIGVTDIYSSTLEQDGEFGLPVLVVELSSPLRDAGMSIRRDGLEMLLASDRTGTLGSFDMWVSTRATTSDFWSPPVNLGPVVNTPGGESRSALSFDGKSLYIVTDRPSGSGNLDIWVSTRTKLKRDDN